MMKRNLETELYQSLASYNDKVVIRTLLPTHQARVQARAGRMASNE
jgi:hypothetical protein